VRPSVAIAVGLPLVGVVTAAAIASGPRLSSPDKSHIGGKVTVKATGLKAGRYGLSLVSDDQPGRHAACVAHLGRRHPAQDGEVRLRGRIPGKLTCYENNSVRLGTVSVTPGAYHLIVAVPDGPAGFNARNSFVRRPLTIGR
jgi:hypothetical protein